ncbi:unnamed protein product, partial [Porites lobata]
MYFKEVDELLLRQYYLYENSPKRLRGLNSILHTNRPLYLNRVLATGTRWIRHKLDALEILVDKYGLFIQHSETLSCDKS